MYGEITAMSAKEGYCWASNKYFASLYGVDKRTITRWVTNLKDCGFISIDFIYYTYSKRVKKRKITLTKDFSRGVVKDTSSASDKNVYNTVDNNVDTPMDKSGEDNNTRVNTIKDNSTSVNNGAMVVDSDIINTIDHYHNICTTLHHYSFKNIDEFKIKQFIQSIDDIKKYFEKVYESNFLSGRNEHWTGCNFLWLIDSNNVEKVLNGNYDNISNGYDSNSESNMFNDNLFEYPTSLDDEESLY
jgi:hypothetical protein